MLKFAHKCDGKLDGEDENESEEENDYDIDDAMSPLVESVSEAGEIVLDGGYLFHRLIWEKESTFRDIISKYVHYVDSHYGQCTVVFDGYCENSSTKDHKHKRRLPKVKAIPNMSFELENRVAESFLNNSKNKQKFINLLSDELELSGNVVVQCTGDADTTIVFKVLDYACAGNSVKLIGADTDLLIMLLYFWKSEMAEITMLSEPTKDNEGIVRNISRIAESISDIRRYVTFAHSFGGYDTT